MPLRPPESQPEVARRAARDRRSRLRRAAPLAPAALLLLQGFALFPAAGRDDAHILYWSAFSLSEYGELWNYNGERVEQSSSLLATLLIAALRLASARMLEPVALGHVAMLAIGGCAVPLAFRLGRALATERAGWASALLLATNAYFVYWCFGGIETPLVAVSLLAVLASWSDWLGAAAATRAGLARASLATALLLLVRPEGPILAGCALLGVLGWALLDRARGGARAREGSDSQLRRLAQLALVAALETALLLGFRWLYFGRLLPQPVYAKSAGLAWASLQQGLAYYAWCVASHPWMLFLALLAALGCARLARRALRGALPDPAPRLALLCFGACAAFVLGTGDWMEGGRFFAMFMPLSLALAAVGLDGILRGRRSFAAAVALLAAIGVADTLRFAARESTSLPIWVRPELPDTLLGRKLGWFERRSRPNLRDLAVIGRLQQLAQRIAAHKQVPVVIASLQMGIVPYHLARASFGRFHFVDYAGLVERSVVDCPVYARARRTSGGLAVSSLQFLKQLPAARKRCGLPEPDLLFDLWWWPPERISELAALGFTAVDLQWGNVVTGSEWFPGGAVAANSFIAVRSEWLVRAGIEPLSATPARASGTGGGAR